MNITRRTAAALAVMCPLLLACEALAIGSPDTGGDTIDIGVGYATLPPGVEMTDQSEPRIRTFLSAEGGPISIMTGFVPDGYDGDNGLTLLAYTSVNTRVQGFTDVTGRDVSYMHGPISIGTLDDGMLVASCVAMQTSAGPGSDELRWVYMFFATRGGSVCTMTAIASPTDDGAEDGGFRSTVERVWAGIEFDDDAAAAFRDELS